jgi:hypothetical protein
LESRRIGEECFEPWKELRKEEIMLAGMILNGVIGDVF